MKVGIISLAHMHALTYIEVMLDMKDVQIVGVADEDQARRGKWADHFKQLNIPLLSDYQELLQQDVDAVIVTSENIKHHEHVLAAARAGKHVLCEKPLATKLTDMREMIDACEEHGVYLGTAFPVRFCTPVAAAKKAIDSGQIGTILAIKGTNHGYIPGGWFIDPSLSGGGAVMDHTVHLADVMRWLMGAEVQEVYAEHDSHFSDDPIDDCGIVTLEFDNGVFATIDCSWSRTKIYPTWGDVTMEIIGTDGIVQVDAFGQKVNVYSETEGVKWDPWGDNMDAGLVQDFIESIRSGKAPLATGFDGLRATEVALAAYQASEQKKTIVLR
ncbi:Gfo/Idh/MocA family oxidoreductase [Paenibacillus sp.]|jgi:predicted dehydrogenase|uniref:Gfo/Idh/MocA family protein n=1 Tax=Paenibacillus sp. TaxID=58172 RepID=UPI00281E8EF0|nr:Gfo/Idh/MocA family oxidoreductase [Paenibacillus sp.]MDR0266748.1 Gfo/Idh/MocA family oxidoreductase [Paenibacillus sp.]